MSHMGIIVLLISNNESLLMAKFRLTIDENYTVDSCIIVTQVSLNSHSIAVFI